MPSSQPGRLPDRGVEAGAAAPGGDEHLLGDVLGVVPVAEGAQRDREDQRRPPGVGGRQPGLAAGPERLLEREVPLVRRPAQPRATGHGRVLLDEPRVPRDARSQGQHHPIPSAGTPSHRVERSSGRATSPDAAAPVGPAVPPACHDARAWHTGRDRYERTACSGVGEIPNRR